MVTKRTVRRITAVFLGVLIIVSFSGFWTGFIVHAEPDHTINVDGRLTYGGDTPIRHAFIRVFDSDTVPPDELKAEGYTDDYGYFSFTGVDNVDWTWWDPLFGTHYVTGIDVYIRCYARNDAVNVMGNPSWLPDWMNGETWYFSTPTWDDVADGTTVHIGTQDAGSMSEAFSIFDAINEGHNFLRESVGVTPPQVTVYWKDIIFSYLSWLGVKAPYCFPKNIPERLSIPDEWAWIIDGLRMLTYGGVPLLTFFDITEEAVLRSWIGIHLRDGDGWDAATVLHEYGHFVMDTYADFWPPDTVLGTHLPDQPYDPEHAWGEGWAHFLSAATREFEGYSEYGYQGYRKNPFDIEENYLGDSVEAAVAGILWDIYDTRSEPLDNAWGFPRIWDVFVNYDPNPGSSGHHHPWNIYEFFAGMQQKYPGFVNQVWWIYMLHGIRMPGVSAPPLTYVDDWGGYWAPEKKLQPTLGSSVSYKISVANGGSETDTFDLRVEGLENFLDASFSTSELTLLPYPAQIGTSILTITARGGPLFLGDYVFGVIVTSRTNPNPFEWSYFKLLISYDPTLPSTPQGGLAVAIKPRTTDLKGLWPARYLEAQIEVLVINNQNFDDTIFVALTNDGIPTNYQADLDWFDYSAKATYIPAMSRFAFKVNIRIPTRWTWPGYYYFKVIAASTAWSNRYAKDFGIILIHW